MNIYSKKAAFLNYVQNRTRNKKVSVS